MADFYQARFAATFFTAGGKEVVLTRVHDLLPAEVEEEWSAGTAAFDCIAHDWGQDVPTGNARLRRSWSVLLCERTRAALERRMRRVEIMLNMHRKGTLLLEEAFSQGAPTLATWWAATLETAKARPLAMESAPGMPGAWGALELSFILSLPSEDPPEDDPGTQEDDPGTQDDPGSQGDPAARCTTWVLNVPDVYAAPWSTDANHLKEALLAIGLTEVQVGGATHDDPEEDWCAWVCPEGSSPACTILVARFGAPGVTRDEVQAAADSGYPWGVAILNPIIS